MTLISRIKLWWALLPIGTKSVLMGVHCFFIHPWMIALAWWKLYGFPFDPRLWAAFLLHDIGYWGKPNMDGPEGETHPELGARIMHWLFDRPCLVWKSGQEWWTGKRWHDLCLYHSRYYSKAHGKPFSKLCVADKLVITIEPWWLYLPRAWASGELEEYFENARQHGQGRVSTASPREWYRTLGVYMQDWVDKHKDGQVDEQTRVRHADHK